MCPVFVSLLPVNCASSSASPARDSCECLSTAARTATSARKIDHVTSAAILALIVSAEYSTRRLKQ